MAKQVTSIVSLLGLVQSIIINLVKRVESLGGSEEDVRVLANPDDPIVQRVAETILLHFDRFAWENLPVRYKNWPAICGALRESKLRDHAIVWANALADPEGYAGKRLSRVFLEFWSETEIQGPVPWSLLQESAKEGFILNNPGVSFAEGEAAETMIMHGAIDEYGLPYQEFSNCTSYLTEPTHGETVVKILSLTNESWRDQKVGSVIHWRGADWIMVENYEGADVIGIVPAECIAMDL